MLSVARRQQTWLPEVSSLPRFLSGSKTAMRVVFLLQSHYTTSIQPPFFKGVNFALTLKACFEENRIYRQGQLFVVLITSGRPWPYIESC